MPHFDRIRPAALIVIIAFFILHVVLNALNNLVLFQSSLYDPLTIATSGLINATLQANVLMLVILVGGVLMAWGKLCPPDFGLIWSGLPRAALLTVVIWLVIQGVLVLIAAANEQPITLDATWTQFGVAPVLGALIGQVFGNALFEEIGYRGFMLPQAYLRLNIRQRWLRVIAALLISQLLFALIHLPSWIANGQDILANAPRVMMLGIFFALFYLVTGNIFLSIGVHALGNRPTPLVAAPGVDSSLLVLAVSLIILIGLWLWQRRAAAHSLSVAG